MAKKESAVATQEVEGTKVEVWCKHWGQKLKVKIWESDTTALNAKGETITGRSNDIRTGKAVEPGQEKEAAIAFMKSYYQGQDMPCDLELREV